MSNVNTKHIIATVALPNNLPLVDAVKQLNLHMQGINFVEEMTGRFEEVPAFVAASTGLEYIFFGTPENEMADSYLLEVSGETTLSIEDFRKTLPEFLGRILVEKTANARGYLDYSEELAKMLRSVGYARCEALTETLKE